MAPTVELTARHLHLVRAAQSAGEAFACPLSEEVFPVSWPGPLGAVSFAWLAFGLIAAALILAF